MLLKSQNYQNISHILIYYYLRKQDFIYLDMCKNNKFETTNKCSDVNNNNDVYG